jgi:hypothetical protein
MRRYAHRAARRGSATPAARSAPRWPIAVLVVAFLVVATLYNVVVPVFEAPDEHAHYYFAQHVAQTGRLPRQTAEAGARGPWEQEGSQPPLYYLLVAPLVRLAGANLGPEALWYNDQNTMGYPTLPGNENRFIHPPEQESWPWQDYARTVHLARFLSTLMGAVTVWLVWLVGLRIFPSRRWLALAVAAVVAFTPQFLFVGASLSNDGLIILLATAMLALLLRLADGHDDAKTILALALVAGLAPLAKLSGLAVLGFTLLCLAGLARRKRDGGWFLRTAGPVVLAAVLLSAWWYGRNVVLYGDVTGLSFMHPGGTRRHEPLARWLAGLPDELVGVWLSSWGLFGWFTVMLPSWIYVLLAFLGFAAVAGVLIALDQRAAWIEWRRFGWLLLWALVVWVSLLRWLAFTKGGQGRLLFPAIAVLAVLLVAGWRKLVGQWVGDRVFVAGVAAGMVALALYSAWGVIRPAYAMAPVIAEADIPATARRVDMVFDERVRLVAIAHPERLVEGQPFPVTLYWQAPQPVERAGYVGLRVDQYLADEVFAGEAQLSYPGAGTSPPAIWPAGPEVHVDRHRLVAPTLADVIQPQGGGAFEPPAILAPLWRFLPLAREPQGLPLLARLSVHLYDPASAAPWPITAGLEPGSSEWSADVVLDPRREPEVRESRRVQPLARFENGIELYAASASASRWSGRPRWRTQFHPPAACLREEDLADGPKGGKLQLLWRATQPVEEDLSAFLHVVDLNGQMVAQSDGPPATYGRLPTSRWRAGQWVPAELSWELPGEARAGAFYGVRLGLYRSGDGTRIAALRADGSRWPDDAVAGQDIAIVSAAEECP